MEKLSRNGLRYSKYALLFIVNLKVASKISKIQNQEMCNNTKNWLTSESYKSSSSKRNSYHLENCQNQLLKVVYIAFNGKLVLRMAAANCSFDRWKHACICYKNCFMLQSIALLVLGWSLSVLLLSLYNFLRFLFCSWNKSIMHDFQMFLR